MGVKVLLVPTYVGEGGINEDASASLRKCA